MFACWRVWCARVHRRREQLLLGACAWGRVDMVQTLLDRCDVDVDARCGEEEFRGEYVGCTALMVAAAHDRVDVVGLLLEFGADVNLKETTRGLTALHIATDRTIVEMLLDGAADPNLGDTDGNTPVHVAAHKNNAGKLAMLLGHGAAVDATNKEGHAPIHVLLKETLEENGVYLDLSDLHNAARVLASHGARWDDTCDQLVEGVRNLPHGFRVALQWWIDQHTLGARELMDIPHEVLWRGPSSVEQYVAARHASDKIVLRRKICVVGPSFWGKTSLVKSISSGAPSLEHPEDRTIGIDQFPLLFSEKAFDDEELLMSACEACDAEAVKWLIETKKVDLRSAARKARACKTPRHHRESMGFHPLHYAVDHAHVAIVHILLDNGAHPDIKLKNEMSPVHIAVARGSVDIVEALIVAGADPNTTDSKGDTPLHYCSKRPEIASVLLKAAADVHATNKKGETPFYNVISSVERQIAPFDEDEARNKVVRQISSRTAFKARSSLQQVAQALILHGAMWDQKCDQIAKRQGEPVRAFREAVAVWIQERGQGTELTTFPIEVFDRGARGIREFVAQNGHRQTEQPVVDEESHADPTEFDRLVSTPLPTHALEQIANPRTSTRGQNHSNGDSQYSRHSGCRNIGPRPLTSADRLTESSNTLMNAEPPTSVKELDVRRHHEVTFWDFAGQEAYQVAHSAFFSKRTLYLVCVDLQAYAIALEQSELRADKDSDIERLMNEFVEAKIVRWIRLILASQPDAEFVFVGTKADVLERSSHRIHRAHQDLSKRMSLFADSVESKACDVDELLERLRVRGASSSTPRTKDKLCSRALVASAQRLRNLEWLIVDCKNEESITNARKAIERVIIKSKRSFQMPDLYSQVLSNISNRRSELAAKRPSDQVKATFWDVEQLCRDLQTRIPQLAGMSCHVILRTLHDIGDVLWFEDLGIEYLKDKVILHPLVLIEFVRQVVHHNHNSEVMRHAALKEQPYWNDLDAERMLVMKQLLQQFHLVHSIGSEMKRESDMIVPAFWRCKESALWLFLGDLLKNDPTLSKIQKAICVQWEYHFTTALPDVMFDELVIESYSSQYDRQTGPDWIMYTMDDQFACRVVVTRAPRTLERVLRVEAVASETATTYMWGRFEHLCESLERVLSRYKGLVVSRFVVDDKDNAWELHDFFDKRMQMPPSRREPQRWLPPSLEWYYGNIMKARAGVNTLSTAA